MLSKPTLKIISDGTRTGTKVIDQETGHEIGQIMSISWDVENPVGVATIKCRAELEVVMGEKPKTDE